MRKKSIAIIGAGFGGLSAAALLSNKGFKVTVFEKNSTPGGRARVWKKDGFTFDMGPSWYLMPDVFEEFFSLFQKKPTDFFKLTRLDPSYRIYFGKDDLVDISAKLDQNVKLFDSLEKDGGKKYITYLKQSKYQYETSIDQFIYKEYSHIFDLFSKKIFLEGRNLHLFENMEKYTKRFFKNDRLRKILQYNLVFLGGSPNRTPALYALMAHLDFNLGVWYPMGGMGKVVEAIMTIAKKNGTNFKFNHEVKKLIIEKGEVKKLKTSHGDFLSDIVISSGDYPFTENKLLEKRFQTYPEKYWEKKTFAPSALIIFLGLTKKIKNLIHHNIFLSEDWTKHFESIFQKPSWYKSPSFYVCAPSKTDPTISPKDCENLFVLVPLAPGLKDTDIIRAEYSDKIISRLEQLINQDIKNYIKVKRIYSHRDFITDYHAYKGSALGLSQTLFQTALFRPSHKSKKVSNLYYTGQYTHPGIGMPICLIASQIVTSEILKSIKYD